MKPSGTQHPTSDEQAEFVIKAFKGIDVGLGAADPLAIVAKKLEEQYPGHLILVQAGTFLHGFDRSEALASYQSNFRHTGSIHRSAA